MRLNDLATLHDTNVHELCCKLRWYSLMDFDYRLKIFRPSAWSLRNGVCAVADDGWYDYDDGVINSLLDVAVSS